MDDICKQESMCAIVLNVVVSIKCSLGVASPDCSCTQVPSNGKKIQAQMRRQAIRNSINLVRSLSQPTTITLDARLSVVAGN